MNKSLSFIHAQEPFSLLLLSEEHVHDQQIISLLSQWRKEHEFWFSDQFPISDARTKKWLQTRVIEVPDRLLFLIKHDQEYFGHVGLFRYDEKNKVMDIDNIVRGKDGYPGLISAALITLMAWGKIEYGLRGYTLQTTSDNQKALNLYQSLGFEEVKREPLVYKKTAEGGQWVHAVEDGTIQRYEVFMKNIYETKT